MWGFTSRLLPRTQSWAFFEAWSNGLELSMLGREYLRIQQRRKVWWSSNLNRTQLVPFSQSSGYTVHKVIVRDPLENIFLRRDLDGHIQVQTLFPVHAPVRNTQRPQWKSQSDVSSYTFRNVKNITASKCKPGLERNNSQPSNSSSSGFFSSMMFRVRPTFSRTRRMPRTSPRL